MANTINAPDKSDLTKREVPTGRPLQRLSWQAKIADNYDWFKKNIDYYIHLSNFNFGTAPAARKDLRMLYQIYNNNFPLTWFSHFTDPLNAANPQHKQYPAKIRPTSMIRTNIDLLLGEYPKRPFSFQVVNMGEDGLNSYVESLNKAVEQNLQEHFMAIAQQQMQAAGHQQPQNAIPQEQEIELPESLKKRFTANYKDNLAIQGQRWLKRALREYYIRPKMLKMFKDWLITGRSYSYKNVELGNFVYERVSPLEMDFDKSPNTDYIEDGEWAIRRLLMTISDVVDRFYDELKDEDHQELEKRSHWVTPFSMYNYLQEEFSKYDTYSGKIPVYHVTWKSRKEILHVEYTDPLTGQIQEMVVDESVPSMPNIKVIKHEWVNEVLEGWRIGDNIFTRMRALPVQRNEMNNYSSCKLPYNGRHYSDTHSDNISVMEMGVPYAIMYMITNFTLEKTIAKNKGKIALIDQNAIPKGNGWNEEKFFYYADALGYMLVNRSQQGVDKSFNQYSTLDLNLFDQIEKLIMLRDSFKKDWDDVLGINAPRKGQTASGGDGLGVQQNLLFQSSVITDMIFTLFEEFTERELQGILDFSRFVNADGIRAIYNQDDFDKELLDIDPNSYCNAELGLFVNGSASELQTLQEYKQGTQTMLQRPDIKLSTVLEVQHSNNVAELKAKLKEIESIEAQQAQANEEAQQEHEKAVEAMKEQFLKIASDLKISEINAEWDRKDQNQMILGEYTLEAAGITGGDANNNGIPDASEISKRVVAASKIASEERKAYAEISSREHVAKLQHSQAQQKLALEREKMKSKERIENKKVQVARYKKASK